nr:hypothetical protein [Tanacetum cinerariifolium]
VVSVPTIDRAERQIPKRSIFPWRKRKFRFRSFKAKGEPLLKKDVREEGGDDIDFDRRMFTSSDESSYGWHRSDEGSTTSRSSISEFGDDNFVVGKESCKEYIKSFLAAIPLRELQADVKKGLMAASSHLVHHRLQIEFHYTKCLEVNTNMSTIAV